MRRRCRWIGLSRTLDIPGASCLERRGEINFSRAIGRVRAQESPQERLPRLWWALVQHSKTPCCCGGGSCVRFYENALGCRKKPEAFGSQTLTFYIRRGDSSQSKFPKESAGGSSLQICDYSSRSGSTFSPLAVLPRRLNLRAPRGATTPPIDVSA